MTDELSKIEQLLIEARYQSAGHEMVGYYVDMALAEVHDERQKGTKAKAIEVPSGASLNRANPILGGCRDPLRASSADCT